MPVSLAAESPPVALVRAPSPPLSPADPFAPPDCPPAAPADAAPPADAARDNRSAYRLISSASCSLSAGVRDPARAASSSAARAASSRSARSSALSNSALLVSLERSRPARASRSRTSSDTACSTRDCSRIRSEACVTRSAAAAAADSGVLAPAASSFSIASIAAASGPTTPASPARSRARAASCTCTSVSRTTSGDAGTTAGTTDLIGSHHAPANATPATAGHHPHARPARTGTARATSAPRAAASASSIAAATKTSPSTPANSTAVESRLLSPSRSSSSRAARAVLHHPRIARTAPITPDAANGTTTGIHHAPPSHAITFDTPTATTDPAEPARRLRPRIRTARSAAARRFARSAARIVLANDLPIPHSTDQPPLAFTRARSQVDPSHTLPRPTMHHPHDIKETLSLLLAGRTLDEPHAAAVFTELLEGRLLDPQIGALLALIATRGPTIEELVGAGRVMRHNVSPVELPRGFHGPVLDTCGTGGAAKTFNISTAAAIVAAAAGQGSLLIAKHGNKSRSGRGSAEVLRELGVNVDAPTSTQTKCLEDAHVCFCFAVHHHPAMRHAAPARQSLGFPTIFNLLGPLTNPARAPRQVMGVYAHRYIEPMANALLRLGSQRAFVLHSSDGMDEISVSAPTPYALVASGTVSTGVFDPRDWGIAIHPRQSLEARDLPQAAAFITEVLRGQPGPRRDAVLVNAAAALMIAEVAHSWPQAIDRCREAIDSGAALQTLERLARTSHERA